LTGARWGLKRAEAVLKLRSLRSSGDFHEYWQYHLSAELKHNHLSRYALPPVLMAA
ncbi:MAG: ISKra4 family transposase, partial [Magnetococcus sp. DMHC-6]